MTFRGAIFTILTFVLGNSVVVAANNGLLTYNTTPPAQTDSSLPVNHQNYVIISKSTAETTGVTFSAAASGYDGTVDTPTWTFPLEFSQSTYSGWSPGNVTISDPTGQDNVDGQTYTVEFALHHVNSEGVVCQTADNPFSFFQVYVPRIDPDSGQSGTTGDIVVSNQVALTGTGQRHYVSPKLTGSFVVLKANAPGITAANFSTYLKWDTSAAGQAVSGSPDKWEVKRDTTGKYTVNLLRVSDSAVVASINVWIIWTNGSIANTPTGTIERQSDTTIDGTATTSTIYTSSDEWKFLFTIDSGSTSITDTSADIPDLTGPKNASPAVPGAGTDSPSPLINPPNPNHLANGANMKWDVSRRYSFPISNPASIPRGKFTSDFGSIYSAAIPNGNAVSFPTNPLIGNDDAGTSDEDNNPYAASTTAGLTHDVGQLTSLDKPTLWMPDAGGANGNTLQQAFIMQEFVRVQVGSSWYVVSDPLEWKIVEILKFSGGQWQDNGSSLGAGN